MSPPLSHRAQSSAGAAPARASDDASSSPPSPTRVSAPGTPTRRRVVSGLAFDHSGEFLPALPLPEDADVDFSSAGAREAGPVLGDPNEIAGVPQAGERRSDATEKALRERGGLYASIPHLRASPPKRESASISSNSIFSNGPRSTPYDAAIPFGSHLEAPSSPEAPSSLSSPTAFEAESREANRDGVGKRRLKTVVKESAGVADDGKDSLRRLFKLPESEVFVEEYLCALYKKILLQGRMYVFQNHVCFYSNVFGYTKVKTIALRDVTIVNRAYTAQVVFNAIEIVHKGKCEFFTSFIFPDRTYKTITRAWRACSRYAKIFADQKTLSGAHDAERSGDGVSGGVSREARSSPEVRAMLGEVDARRLRTTLNANDETDGPPSSTGSLSALRDAERDDEDVLEASSKRDEDEDASLDLDARVPAFKAATVAGGGHGRRASAPALRLASSAVLAAAPAGGEELDEPSVPPSGPLSADESDEDLPDLPASFCVGPTGADPFLDKNPFLDKDALDALPPLPARPADHATLVESFVVECSVARFFALAWSDAAGESFTPACAEARKHRELRVTPWRAHRGYGHARDLTFVAPTNASIGPRETHCHQTQSYRVYKTRVQNGMDDALPGVALVVDTSQVQKDIPYGDYFRVESRWVCRAAPPRLSPDTATFVNERCEVWVGLRIPFQKTTMLRKVIEKSALEESRASVMGALALVERRLASDASLADSSDTASGLERTRVSPPRHRRQRSFADAVAETVDVSKLLIPEGSQDIIWRMLFGSKERSPRGKEDASSARGGGSELSLIGEADEAPDRGRGSAVASAAAAADGARRLKRRDQVDDKTMGSTLMVERVATSVARLVKPARAALASLLFWKILAAALVAWLAARLVDGDGTDPTSRWIASTAESLFSSRDSAVADVARWKRRAASLELELQALERRAAFVAGEAAHARAALADAMDRTAPEPRSAARGGFFSS